MLQGDPKEAAIKAAVEGVKRSVKLQGDNQSPKFSGHESAPYGEGGPSAGGPSSKGPGTTG
jgi:hypothetical protein